jgi:Haem-binding domain
MKLWAKRSVLGILAFLVVAQLIRPATVNPPIDPAREIAANFAVKPAVQSIFDRSCNDCHSNRTVWPWYSHVAPMSWLVASDVNDGRRHLNFSEWGSYPAEKRAKLLDEICKEVREGDMPPFQYTPMHTGSKLTKADQEQVCSWAIAGKQN